MVLVRALLLLKSTLLCLDSGSGGRALLRIAATEDLAQLTGKSPALAGRELTSVLSGSCQLIPSNFISPYLPSATDTARDAFDVAQLMCASFNTTDDSGSDTTREAIDKADSGSDMTRLATDNAQLLWSPVVLAGRCETSTDARTVSMEFEGSDEATSAVCVTSNCSSYLEETSPCYISVGCTSLQANHDLPQMRRHYARPARA